METKKTNKRKAKPKFRVVLQEPLKPQAERQDYAIGVLCSLALKAVTKKEAVQMGKILES